MKFRTRFVVALAATFICCSLFVNLSNAQDDDHLLISNVSIIDVVSGEVNEGMSILVKNDRIVDVARDIAIKDGENVTKIDGQGKFAIPGLWDMHIHWYEKKSMALFPLNGVTGVRVMWGNNYHHKWRTSFDEGEALGPRMYIGSPIVDGPNPIWPGSLIVDSPESAKEAVDKSIEMNSDFLKVYSLLSRDAYTSIAAECKEREIPFDGHVPFVISAKEASDAGHRSMAHMYELVISCSSEEDELRKMQNDFLESNENSSRKFFANADLRAEIARRAFESFDEKKAEALFETFVKNGTWQCPTLTVLRNINYLSEPEVQENENLKYISPFLRRSIAPKGPAKMEGPQVELNRKQFELQKKLLLKMHLAGVRVLAGTDCLNPFCLPGFSLHTELELLVDAGFEPIDALRAATINAAEFMGQEDELGSIEKGKLADLVLLDANPLENITNSKSIHSVVQRGSYLSREKVDELLDSLEHKKKSDSKKSDNDE